MYSKGKRFRFSPIENKQELFQAMEYIHLCSFRLCRQNLGYLLPVAGNIGVFCHYDDEYSRLVKIRKELTDISHHWNQKYFRLYRPVTFPAVDEIPETTYSYLYIRRPQIGHDHVGDVDFYLESDKYRKLKSEVMSGKYQKGVTIFERPDLDLVRLSDPEIDVSAFVGSYDLKELTS